MAVIQCFLFSFIQQSPRWVQYILLQNTGREVEPGYSTPPWRVSDDFVCMKESPSSKQMEANWFSNSFFLKVFPRRKGRDSALKAAVRWSSLCSEELIALIVSLQLSMCISLVWVVNLFLSTTHVYKRLNIAKTRALVWALDLSPYPSEAPFST